MEKNRSYLIIQSLLLVLVLGLFAAGAVALYLEGAPLRATDPFYEIYSRSKSIARLASIAPYFFILLGMIVGGWLLGAADENAEKPVQDAETARDLLCARVQVPTYYMKKERSFQKAMTWAGWLVFVLCMIPVLLFCLNGAHFDHPEVADQDFFPLLKVLVPWAAAGFLWLCITAALRIRSMKKEIEAAKAAMAEEKETGITAEVKEIPCKAAKQSPGRGVLVVRYLLMALAIVMIVAGVRQGGFQDVVKKATAICMECIGLG